MNPMLNNIMPALPELGLALIFLMTWISPRVLGSNWVKSLLLTLLAEMLLLSAAFALWRIEAEGGFLLVLMWGLLGLYVLAAWGLSRLFQSWWPMVVLGLLLASRWWVDGLPLLASGIDDTPELLAFRGIALMAAVVVTTIVPLPRLGMSPELVREIRIPGDGIWVDHPERLLATGLLYFSAIACARMML
jgi:hypothetical protein